MQDFESRAISSAPMKCSVEGVKGTDIRRWSRFCERKLWRAALSEPLCQDTGRLPSGSPVLGTM